ncbi:hypothetical protein BGX31_003401 [Mortierella sp. GBA43]|nr:hypothetical protein BGX31_003401 [Mortierella sp. GBA43]
MMQDYLRMSTNRHLSFAQGVGDGQVELMRYTPSLTVEMAKGTDLTPRAVGFEVTNQTQLQALRQHSIVQQRESRLPYLFIVLPFGTIARWDDDPLSNKFGLHFLCDPGKDLQTDNAMIPHRPHLTDHPGYEIARPAEFFQRFGSYVLIVMKALRLEVAAVGVNGCQLHNPGAFDRAGCLAADIKTEGEQALGKVDLRGLETFLKRSDKVEAPQDFYRIATAKEHVMWICLDHYRGHYSKTAVRGLHLQAASLQGSFSENVGRVEVTLESNEMANDFYHALKKVKTVVELGIILDWETTERDLRKLRDTLRESSIVILDLDIRDGDPNSGLDGIFRQQTIFEIMQRRSIWSLKITGALDLFDRRHLLPQCGDFSNLRSLDIADLRIYDKHVACFKDLIAKSPNLAHLIMDTEWRQLPAVYNAIAKHHTFLIDIRRLGLRILPPKADTAQRTLQGLDHLFRIHGKHIETFKLDGEPSDSVVEAFAEVIGTGGGSNLKELTLGQVSRRLNAGCIKNLARIVASSPLLELTVYIGEDDARVRILESIQWKHLRKLKITLLQELDWMKVMRALVDGIAKAGGGTKLEEFALVCPTHGALSSSMKVLIEFMVSSTPLRRLHLSKALELEQVLRLTATGAFSRMQHLTLWTQNFGSMDVEIVMDVLQHAPDLQTLFLGDADCTMELKTLMKTRGITLRSN